MEPGPGSLAEYFDAWYADMPGSPVKDQVRALDIFDHATVAEVLCFWLSSPCFWLSSSRYPGPITYGYV